MLNLVVQFLYYKIFLGTQNLALAGAPIKVLAQGVVYAGKPTLILLERLVTVSLGVGTIALVIAAGKKLSRRLEVGLFAGMIMAICTTNVSLSRSITPDTYATFFIAAAILASLYILQDGFTWAYIVSGICLGLGVSSKYNSGLLLILILTAHFLRTGKNGFKDIRIYLSLINRRADFYNDDALFHIGFPELS